MERCLSIDFGNSFTKLAIRPARDEASRFVRHADLDWDRGLNLCVPTLAVRVGEEPSARWFFGVDALDVPAFTPGAIFFRDWKRDFFRDAEQSAGDRATLERRWRIGVGVDELDEIVRGYFAWLRGFVDEALEAEGQAPLGEETVVRVAIPSFALNSRAEAELLDVLRGSDFVADPVQPTLPEPLANAIGIFAEGRNALAEGSGNGRSGMDLHAMFSGTELINVVAGRAQGLGGPRTFWTLVVDLGAYTVDFAMIGFSTGDLRRSLMTTFYGRDRFALHSEPIGISDLYRSIRDELYPGKRGVFDEIVQGRVPGTLIPFLDNLFFYRRPFEYRETGMVFGEPGEVEKIHDVVKGFAGDLAARLKTFMKSQGYHRVDEVIMTGGGMNVPEVRDALFATAQKFQASHAFVPAHPEEALDGLALERIHPLQVRGATALGGTSVFFDEAVEILNG